MAAAPRSGAPAHRRTSQPVRTTVQLVGTAVLAILIIGAILIAMGARWEHGDPSPAPMTTTQELRQSLAVASQRCSAAATDLAAETGGYAAQVFQDVAEHASAWENQLGGVWQAWPSGAPAGHTNSPEPSPLGPDAAELLAELSKISTVAVTAADALLPTAEAPVKNGADGATGGTMKGAVAREEISEEAAGERALYLAMALRATWDAQTVAEAAGLPAPDPFGAEDAGGPRYDVALLVPAGGDEKLLAAANTARQWYEVDAARRGMDGHAERMERIARIADLEEALLRAGTPDTRAASVPLPAVADDELASAAYATLIGALWHSPVPATEALNFVLALDGAGGGPNGGSGTGAGGAHGANGANGATGDASQSLGIAALPGLSPHTAG
ncbi:MULTISPECIES: hypothetical protein [Actinotignum]|uniref:DUF4439 domain-containing protein n=1 Tax=Actinotignum timonense TaxID=1870995 RepID=A0AAW9H9K4_9ACTO|nr:MULTISPECIES: hypothetical protein [Actinotignum]MDE1557679.1 hypothetical protein [Actinotignum schaalii]MDE1662952.1 hypothetical protein [Actinotignum schaalii]MDK6373450.1 hypothetical protein [Actinotignum timonense]MDK6418325.1 hypothetical protein [Actinotignum timonense]MDK6589574.1 hypothetical protein [Actinotignum timonense]